MKQKISDKSKKYIIVPIAALGLIAVLALGSVDTVNAYGTRSRRSDLSETIASKFGLNHAQVVETMDEYHQQRMVENHNEREARLEEKLTQAVAQGSLSESQRYAILEKHEEMAERMQEIHDQDLSRDEMHELKADIHEEMQAWAEENGIEYEAMMRAERGMMNGGQGQYRYAR